MSDGRWDGVGGGEEGWGGSDGRVGVMGGGMEWEVERRGWGGRVMEWEVVRRRGLGGRSRVMECKGGGVGE